MVKICGITSLEDAEAAIHSGADALGFMFYEPSKRFITPEQAGTIMARIPPSVHRVGVFVDAGVEAIRRCVEVSGIEVIQLHGDETPEFCELLRPLTIWKAFRMESARTLDRLRQYQCADAWLLDSYVKDAHGGTGRTFNWDLAVEAGRNGHPVILAGGLTPGNVAAAVERVKPYGVDVSSGVESAPGTKDHRMIARFVKAAKADLH